MGTNPFTAGQRTTDIDFGDGRSGVMPGNITIGIHDQFKQLPKELKFMNPDCGIVLHRTVKIGQERDQLT